MPIVHKTDYNPDGTVIGQSATDKVGFFGTTPVMQRSNPMQSIIQGQFAGEIRTQTWNTAPAQTNAITCVEQIFNITSPSIAASDFCLAINLPAACTVGMAGWRVSSANNIGIQFCNPAGNLTQATGLFKYVLARGILPVSVTLSPTAVPCSSAVLPGTSEQLFTIAGTGAAGTAVLEGDKVKAINLTNAGSGYYNAPTVKIASSPSTITTTATGTMAGLPVPPIPGGSGASAVAIISATGTVIGVQVTEGGSGYTSAPIVTFEGGNNISPGMCLWVEKSATQAGLGIGNVRIVDDRTIAIEFVNPTAGALTPTALGTYRIIAMNELQAINNIVMYGINVGTATAVATTTAAIWTIPVTQIAEGDSLVSTSKPSLQTAIIITPGYCSAGNIIIQASGLGAQQTPTANEVYNCAVWRRLPLGPGFLFCQTLTPTACAPNAITEIAYTVAGIPAGSVVYVNKPSYTAGISIGSARVTGAGTIAIAYMNTTAGVIIPPAENYTIYCFPVVDQGLTTSWVSSAASLTFNQLVDLANEVQTAEVVSGIIKGS
jgi:hypothetical protein